MQSYARCLPGNSRQSTWRAHSKCPHKRARQITRVRVSSQSVQTTTSRIKLSENFIEKLEEQVSSEFFPSEIKQRELLPLQVHYLDFPYLLANWALLREAVVVTGEFSRAQKETLASFVSGSNECNFCANSHKLFAIAKGADDTVRQATTVGDPSILSDKKLADIISWMVSAQQKDSPVLKEAPPFSKTEAPEVICTAVEFNYINRIVDSYITQDEFLPAIPWWLKLVAKVFPEWFENSTLIKAASKTVEAVPGDFLKLVESNIVVPNDLKWMSTKPYIQQALSLWDMAWDDLGKRFIPASLRKFVGDYIRSNYDGSEPPLSRKWVFEVAEKFDGSEAERSAIRFMLLIAFARFQIDDEIMSDLEQHYPDQDARDALGMWPAFLTARTIAGWQANALKYAK